MHGDYYGEYAEWERSSKKKLEAQRLQTRVTETAYRLVVDLEKANRALGQVGTSDHAAWFAAYDYSAKCAKDLIEYISDLEKDKGFKRTVILRF